MKFLVGKRADINSKDNDGVSETTYTDTKLQCSITGLSFELTVFPGTQEKALHSPSVHK